MKITSEHYEAVKAAIAPVLTRHPNAEYEYQEARLTPRRLRWDLLRHSRLKIGDGVGMDGLPLYQYMNDNHIDTALRSICRDFNLQWAAS